MVLRVRVMKPLSLHFWLSLSASLHLLALGADGGPGRKMDAAGRAQWQVWAALIFGEGGGVGFTAVYNNNKLQRGKPYSKVQPRQRSQLAHQIRDKLARKKRLTESQNK